MCAVIDSHSRRVFFRAVKDLIVGHLRRVFSCTPLMLIYIYGVLEKHAVNDQQIGFLRRVEKMRRKWLGYSRISALIGIQAKRVGNPSSLSHSLFLSFSSSLTPISLSNLHCHRRKPWPPSTGDRHRPHQNAQSLMTSKTLPTDTPCTTSSRRTHRHNHSATVELVRPFPATIWHHHHHWWTQKVKESQTSKLHRGPKLEKHRTRHRRNCRFCRVRSNISDHIWATPSPWVNSGPHDLPTPWGLDLQLSQTLSHALHSPPAYSFRAGKIISGWALSNFDLGML